MLPGLGLVALLFLAQGCASRRLPKYEAPLKHTQFQNVRTTAYTHTESDHRAYANRNALGTPLRCGVINSAAADWARWPVGTQFRIVGAEQIYEIDDYGWALAGRNTIDLYMPTRQAMNQWGARKVQIQILHWGSVQRSHDILKPRRKHAHVKRMLKEINEFYGRR